MKVTQWDSIYRAREHWLTLPATVGEFYPWVEAEAGVKILDYIDVRVVDINRYTLFLIKYSQ
jgi:hypothetical protein